MAIGNSFGSFNEEELTKLKKATSGFFRKSARKAIAQTLLETKAEIERVQKLDAPKRGDALLALANHATQKRHDALQAGAKSYSHPQWAAAAACESWLHSLVLRENDEIDDAALSRIEYLIDHLMHQ